MVVIVGCSRPRSQPHQATSPAQGGTVTQDEPLFLHLLSPRTYTPPIPAHRIVTARVYPFLDFAISIGDLENPFFTNRWDGAWTSPRLSKAGFPEARPLESLWDSGDAVLAGRIERTNGRFSTILQGRDRTTLNYFNGEIELEKPVCELGGYYRGGTVRTVWFALSRNPDCSHFLRALEDGSLSRPDVVDKDSPAVERWVRGEQNTAPRPPSAER